MKFKSEKISALAIVLAISLTTFAFPLTARAAEEQPGYTYKTYQGKTSGKVKVTDAYKKTYAKNIWGMKATLKIPKITIPGVDTSKFNKKIYKFCKSKADPESSCTYSYYIGKKYISLIIYRSDEHDMSPTTDSYIYNISTKTGKQMSRSQMLKALNLKSSKFEAKVEKGLRRYWDNMMLQDDTMLNNQIRNNKLKEAIPYVNSKGKVCFVLKSVMIPAGSGSYDVWGKC